MPFYTGSGSALEDAQEICSECCHFLRKLGRKIGTKCKEEEAEGAGDMGVQVNSKVYKGLLDIGGHTLEGRAGSMAGSSMEATHNCKQPGVPVDGEECSHGWVKTQL